MHLLVRHVTTTWTAALPNPKARPRASLVMNANNDDLGALLGVDLANRPAEARGPARDARDLVLSFMGFFHGILDLRINPACPAVA
jgi:hypothetical protein